MGPLEPAKTAERLLTVAMISIAGNQDRLLISPTEECKLSANYQSTSEQLQGHHLNWLKGLASTDTDEQFFLCHGTPDSDETYLLEHVSAARVGLNDKVVLERLLRRVPQKVVLCAHSHVPRLVRVNEQLIVNPGSVGLPAYSDELPFPHAMETYSPYARYAIISPGARCTVEHLAIPYPWQTAVAKAKQNGQEAWAYWLETGRDVTAKHDPM